MIANVLTLSQSQGSSSSDSSLLPPAVATADQTINSTTTFVNSTYLLVPLSANKRYAWQIIGIFNSASVPDFAYTFSIPSLATGNWIANLSLAQNVLIYGNAAVAGGNATDRYFSGQGWVTTAGTAGNLQMKFAQNVSNVSNTTLVEKSALLVWELD